MMSPLVCLRVGQHRGRATGGPAHQGGVRTLEHPPAIQRQQQRNQIVDSDDHRARLPPRRPPIRHERDVSAQPGAVLPRKRHLLEPELGQVDVDAVEGRASQSYGIWPLWLLVFSPCRRVRRVCRLAPSPQ